MSSSFTDRSDEIELAITIGELNADSAESAPQQQVVNGWLAADLHEIQAKQLNDIQESQSTTNIMLGLIGAIVAIGFLAVVLHPREVDAVPAAVGSEASPDDVEPSAGTPSLAASAHAGEKRAS